jgi:periplasmic copper chaperone A
MAVVRPVGPRPGLARRLVGPAAVAGGLACGLVLLAAAPASAHVTVNSADAERGGFAQLNFRVPTEKDNAATVRVRVQLPTDQPLASVSVKPHPGWTATVRNARLPAPVRTDDGKVTEAPAVITWTAAKGGGIGPGQYDEFSISAGPLPKTESITFKAIQTYSDGSQVSWIEDAAGGAEPEHPAPTLKLTAAAEQPATATAVTATRPADDGDVASKGAVTAALALAVVGLLVGVAGIGLALTARRRTPGAPPAS